MEGRYSWMFSSMSMVVRCVRLYLRKAAKVKGCRGWWVVLNLMMYPCG